MGLAVDSRAEDTFMPRAPRRPAPVRVGPLIAYARRAPADGEPRWYWQVVTHTGPDQYTVPGGSGRFTRAQLDEHLARLLATGAHVADPEPEDDEEIRTMGDLLLAWLEQYRELPRTRVSSYESHKRRARRLRPLIGEISVERWSVAHVEQLRDGLLREGLSTRYVRALYGTVVCAWNWALDRETVPNRRMPRLRLEIGDHARDRYTPYDHEVTSLLPYVSDRRPWALPVLTLLWCTGARPHDVAQIQLGGIDLDQGLVIIPPNTKTGSRTIAVPRGRLDAVAAYMARYPQGDRAGRLWHVLARTIVNTLPTALDEALAAAEADGVKLQRWTPYGLRRLASSNLIEAGVDPSTYRDVMGHSYEVGVRWYAESRPHNRRAATALLGRPAERGQVVEGPWARRAEGGDDDR